MRTEPTYTLYATFGNIGGLKAHSPIGISGIVAGRVTGITLGPKTYLPRVTPGIEQRYNHVPDTSSLSIRASGLLGEQYLALSVGFESSGLRIAILKNGDIIQNAKSTVILEDPIGQLFYGSEGDDNKNSDGTPAATPGDNETTEPVGATK